MTLPEVKYAATSDQTSKVLGVRCAKLEGPLPGGTLNQFWKWRNIAKLIESLP